MGISGLMAVAMLATPLLGTAEACGFRRRCRRATFCGRALTVTDMDSYTEYVGTLGGANFVIRIPDEWNGMLVVGCHGYMQLWTPDAQFAVDNLVNGEGIGLPFALVEQGFAYAASSYGEGGFSVKMGMISTRELTKYTLDLLRSYSKNFKNCWKHNDNWHTRRGTDVKVFLIGHSMGGVIGLLLGEKYPELYDGVLDISDMKNITMGYTDMVALINGQIFPTLPPPAQAMFLQLKADMEAECGGTYDDKPKAYERINPVSHAEISIPIISVNGAQDPLTPPPQAVSYKIAVAEAGCSEYYRLYTANPGQHADPPTIDAALSHFEELVDYPVGW